MGGFSHLFNFHCGSMAKKVFNHKGHDDGLEAPRNSLELQAENFQSYSDEEDIPYSYQIGKDCSEKNNYPVEASIRKLINEEISKPSDNGRNAPSIVARLMGVDMLPMDTKPIVFPCTKSIVLPNRKSESVEVKSSRRDTSKKSSVSLVRCKSDSFRQTELGSFYEHDERDSDQWNSVQKPRSREHPQEEELQKFKKEFLACQAAKFREYMGLVDVDNISGQFLAQENLNKKKLELHLSGRTASEKPLELEAPIKAKAKDTFGVHVPKDKTDLFSTEHKIRLPKRSKTLSRDWEQPCLMSSPQEVDEFSIPSRIVVLKPGPDKICNHEDSWSCSPSTSEEKSGIEDFLEEVRERLKCEMQGKSFKKGTVARGSGIETPYSEKPSFPRHIARHIAKQVRETVARDFEKDSLRSDSTRSYRSELLSNGSCSPEPISRDTQKFLIERLRNVLRKESYVDIPEHIGGRSRSLSLDSGNERQNDIEDPLPAVNDMNYWDTVEDQQEMQTRSFRHQPEDDGELETQYPRNLVRSMSAPASGTSFGKLLLEDRHILTGAHIRRKHESAENKSKSTRKNKRERFSFREKVSHLRYSFSLRGRLFGRKIQSAAVRRCFEQNPGKDLMGRPTLLSFYERHENFTEVPPSPVSVCSSMNEEFWRPAHNASPVSTPDLTSREDITTPNVFREISSNLKELRRQLNQLESDVPEETLETKEHMESEMLELEDNAELFIRDLLVASGLYDGSSDISLSRWDPLAKPISMSVFKEVEKSYRKMDKEDENCEGGYSEREMDHKVLFDLLNEALSIVLGPPVNCTKFRREIMGCLALPPPRGRKLLDTVWEIITAYLYPQTDGACSIEDMVASDLNYTPWSVLVDDEVSLIGKQLETLIVGDLIRDVLKEMLM